MAKESSWTDHVLAGPTWRRFGFMLIFVPVLCCALFLMGFTALFQFFSMLASGETNPQLTSFGHGLSRFSAEIMDYLTYNTEQRPYPFSRWRGDEASDRAPGSARRARRPARRKRTARTAAQRQETGTPAVTPLRLQPKPTVNSGGREGKEDPATKPGERS